MDCAQVRAVLSARLDGEDSGSEDTIADAHLGECAQCQQWFAAAADLGRRLRVGVVSDAGPQASADDLIQQLLAPSADHAVGAPAGRGAAGAQRGPAGSGELVPRVGVSGWVQRRQAVLLGVRVLLVLIALGYVVWGVVILTTGTTPGLIDSAAGSAPQPGALPAGEPSSVPGSGAGAPFGGAADPTMARLAVQAATTRFALASGLAWAAWRPRAAGHLLPVYVGLWAFGLGFATRDIVLGVLGMAGDFASAVGPVAGYFAAALALGACAVAQAYANTPVDSPLGLLWRALAARPVAFSSSDFRSNTVRERDREIGER